MTEQNATSYTDLEHVMVMCRIFVAKVSFRIREGSLELEHVIQSPSEARGLGNENGRSRRNRVVGGLGGFPPHYRAYLAPPASRGGVWGGSSPPF